MKTSKISILSGLIGLALGVSSIVRWYWIYYDPSQAVLGAGIGLLVILLSYIYNWMKMTDRRIDSFEKRLDAVVMSLMGLEKEQVRNDIMGEI